MSVDIRLLTSPSNDVASEDFTVYFKGYISFPVIKSGGYSTLDRILYSCDSTVLSGNCTNDELVEYDSYFIKRKDFECIELPSCILDQYSELMQNSLSNDNYLIIQPF